MTSVEAMKSAVYFWWQHAPVTELGKPPQFVTKLCHVIYKLTRLVFNNKTGVWEDEGFGPNPPPEVVRKTVGKRDRVTLTLFHP